MSATANNPFIGDWSILSHGYPGKLLLQQGLNGSISGQIQYDAGRLGNSSLMQVEALTDIVSREMFGGWYLIFKRPTYTQTYFGILSADRKQIHGHFEDANKNYSFDATRVQN